MATSDDREEWRPVVGFEGWYEVSNWGRVRRDARARDWRSRGDTRTPVRQRTGYYQVILSVGGKITGRTVHSMVMEAFVGPRPSGYETNHKDGDKSNCRLGNLEYTTISENRKHAFRLGLNGSGEEHWTHRFGVGHPGGRKLTDADILAIRTAVSAGESQYKLAVRYGVSRRSIQKWVHDQSVVPMAGPTKPWKAYNHPSDDDVREILRLVADGGRITDIARRFGLSRSYLYKVMRGELRQSATADD